MDIKDLLNVGEPVGVQPGYRIKKTKKENKETSGHFCLYCRNSLLAMFLGPLENRLNIFTMQPKTYYFLTPIYSF